MSIKKTTEHRYMIIRRSTITECAADRTEIRSEETTPKVCHRFEALMIKKIHPKYLK